MALNLIEGHYYFAVQAVPGNDGKHFFPGTLVTESVARLVERGLPSQ